MPYKRRYPKKRTMRKRPRRKNYSTDAKASKALKLAKTALGNQEVKYVQVTTGSTEMELATELVAADKVSFCDLFEGTDQAGDLVGAEISPLSLYFRLHATANTFDGNTFRLIIFSWRDEASDVPQPRDLLEDTGLTPQQSMFAFKSQRYKKKITYIHDKVYNMTNYPMPSTGSRVVKNIKLNLKNLPKKIIFEDNNTTPVYNGIYYYIYCNSTVAGSNPTYQVLSRLYYRDS